MSTSTKNKIDTNREVRGEHGEMGNGKRETRETLRRTRDPMYCTDEGWKLSCGSRKSQHISETVPLSVLDW